MGERAECMRKGTIWKDIEENRKRLALEAPHVEFKISSTVSVFNAQHILDFFEDWLEKDWVKLHHLDVNLLLEVEYNRAQILPKQVRINIQRNIDKFLKKYNVKEVDRHGRTYHSLVGFKNFLSEDKTHLIPEFLKWSNLLDSVSGDNLFQVFPELQILKDYKNEN